MVRYFLKAGLENKVQCCKNAIVLCCFVWLFNWVNRITEKEKRTQPLHHTGLHLCFSWCASEYTPLTLGKPYA